MVTSFCQEDGGRHGGTPGAAAANLRPGWDPQRRRWRFPNAAMPARMPAAPVTPASVSSSVARDESEPPPAAGRMRFWLPGIGRSMPSTVFTDVGDDDGAVELARGVPVPADDVGVCVFGGLVFDGVAVFVAVSTGVAVAVFTGVLVNVAVGVAVSTGVFVAVGVCVYGVCVTPGVCVTMSSVAVTVTCGVCVPGVRVVPAVRVATTVRVPAAAVPVATTPALADVSRFEGTLAAWATMAADSSSAVAIAADADRRRAYVVMVTSTPPDSRWP